MLSARFAGGLAPTEGPNGPVLNPPRISRVYWWSQSAKPGPDADGTAFVLGHTVRGSRHGVFDDLQDTKVGQTVTVTTTTARLQYAVTKVSQYPRDRLNKFPEVWRQVPGRIVLIGCFLNDDGSEQTKNFVVYAKLTGWQPNTVG